MTDHAAEATEHDPEDRKKWAELAPDPNASEELPPSDDDETSPGSLGGDNGGG